MHLNEFCLFWLHAHSDIDTWTHTSHNHPAARQHAHSSILLPRDKGPNCNHKYNSISRTCCVSPSMSFSKCERFLLYCSCLSVCYWGGDCILPCCIQFRIAKSAKWFKFGTQTFELPMEREKQTWRSEIAEQRCRVQPIWIFAPLVYLSLSWHCAFKITLSEKSHNFGFSNSFM